MIKNMKLAELNIIIATVFLNMQSSKLILVKRCYPHKYGKRQ